MIYGSDKLGANAPSIPMSQIVESFLYDDLSRCTTEQIQEFCVSEKADMLLEKGVFKKPTLMRLGKEDDQKRRIKLIVYQLAEAAGDADWKKLKKNRIEDKKIIKKLMKRYGSRAKKMAIDAQKDYIKVAQKMK